MDRGRGFEILTRIGFASRGLLYGLIGWLALRTGRAEDGPGILDYLAGGSGRLLVGGMAVGFLGYGAWRLLEAWVDSEGRGTDASGLVIRAGGIASGLVHLGLAFLAFRVAFEGDGPSDADSAEQGAATMLSLPGGWLLLAAAAAGFLIAGLHQLGKAYKREFLEHLDPKAARQTWVAWLGRAGIAARGLVFLVVAWLLWQSAEAGRASEAGGIGEAIASLPGALQLAVAAGLLLFGLFSLVEARYRRIRTRRIGAELAGALR